jgi:hypothetical protein
MCREAAYVPCVTAEFRAGGGVGGCGGDKCNRIASVITEFNISVFLT